MPRLLRYVSGVRLIADPYDLRLWHFTISGKRYNLLAARGGTFALHADDGTPMGRFQDWGQAVAFASERAHDSATERLPIISPYTRASLAR